MSSEISSKTKPFGDMCKIKYDMNTLNIIVNKLFKQTKILYRKDLINVGDVDKCKICNSYCCYCHCVLIEDDMTQECLVSSSALSTCSDVTFTHPE